MTASSARKVGNGKGVIAIGLLLVVYATAFAADWPQYRGPTTDGISPDLIATNWPASGPTVVWSNMSLTNGFSSFAVSQGRAFAMMSQDNGSGAGSFIECCAAVDAATGELLWITPIDVAPWDPTVEYNGGDGRYPYNTGDGPRTTPSVKAGRVITLSGLMRLVCLNATNGVGIWTNDLVATMGASIITWENAQSPCLDGDLVFINLNSSTNDQNLAAFRISDGSLAWSALAENVTHTTPIVTTISGVRQVIFATQTGIVALDRTTGAFLWKFTYPFDPISTSMGASPLVYSNLVFCTASYGRGAAAARVTLANGNWSVNTLYFRTGLNYRSIWMTPVCYQGYVYTLCGDNSTFLTTPLNCIELETGDLKWAINDFGMGGLILVNTNLLVLTEDGQLVLVQPAPDGYHELARYQAFHFGPDSRGKCWISPAASDGRIYAHSTIGGICLDVSVPAATSPLKFFPPRLLGANQLQLVIGTGDGSPILSGRFSKIAIRATGSLGAPRASWSGVTNQPVLGTDGLVRFTVPLNVGPQRQFYTAIEQP
jgi:outer membrane protein assembly factor BamB